MPSSNLLHHHALHNHIRPLLLVLLLLIHLPHLTLAQQPIPTTLSTTSTTSTATTSTSSSTTTNGSNGPVFNYYSLFIALFIAMLLTAFLCGARRRRARRLVTLSERRRRTFLDPEHGLPRSSSYPSHSGPGPANGIAMSRPAVIHMHGVGRGSGHGSAEALVVDGRRGNGGRGRASRWPVWRCGNRDPVARFEEGLDGEGLAPPPYFPGDKPPGLEAGEGLRFPERGVLRGEPPVYD